ncbi:hypothetical protein [Streptomyces anulatus]|uniref:hypothetical protein n=1 Tax=Streptomyces anulatus TaxID=1892 RepID=UPI002E2FCF4D|nr:hypothetical protein [Streptomyces anulatus]
MGRVSAEKRRAAVERLSRLREDEALTAAHVRTVAEGLEVSERTVWRWLAPPKPAAPAVRAADGAAILADDVRYGVRLTDADDVSTY